jgi:uncharacterized protein involved in cysteine biosynthesis
MAFLCTFSGLTIALVIWVAAYSFAISSSDPWLQSLAPYLEAFSITGQCLFVVLAAVGAWLTYRLMRTKPE